MHMYAWFSRALTHVRSNPKQSRHHHRKMHHSSSLTGTCSSVLCSQLRPLTIAPARRKTQSLKSGGSIAGQGSQASGDVVSPKTKTMMSFKFTCRRTQKNSMLCADEGRAKLNMYCTLRQSFEWNMQHAMVQAGEAGAIQSGTPRAYATASCTFCCRVLTCIYI